jgi:N-acetylglucosaminyldiphosphoundecaprenol N-acetyl-beta-D-mannosaminyltransferase
MASTGWAEHALLVQRRREFLGAPMHALSMAETIGLAEESMRTRQPLLHTVVNVAKLVTMKSNAELREDVGTADVINVDGIGVLWGARLLGVDIDERVAGIDVMTEIFALCASKGYRPFLLGAEQHVLDAMVDELARRYPDLVVAGTQHGYFAAEQEADVIAAINASGADCLFVALPTPRKERFLKRYRHELAPSFVMGVGGSFDVFAGKVVRAPALVQRLGFEWLFRVAQEPKRLWRRYYETNTAYAALLWQAYRTRSSAR